MFDALSPDEWDAIVLSLKVGLVSVAVSLPFGLFFAWLLARREFPGKSLLDGVIHLPLVVPPVVVGYLLLVLLGRKGLIGEPMFDWFGITVAFRWQGAAIASAVMGFPLMVRAIRLSLDSIDRGLESAARTLGAGPFDVFRSVTLPLIAPGILTGVILAFARSLGEFGATITFVSNIPGETRTLPIALYTYTQIPGGDLLAFRLAGIAVILALVALMVSELMARRIRARLEK
ncbi:MAG: molybdate ABC transporter permease subunit [Alphaproteobacteria bacterium]